MFCDRGGNCAVHKLTGKNTCNVLYVEGDAKNVQNVQGKPKEDVDTLSVTILDCNSTKLSTASTV